MSIRACTIGCMLLWVAVLSSPVRSADSTPHSLVPMDLREFFGDLNIPLPNISRQSILDFCGTILIKHLMATLDRLRITVVDSGSSRDAL
ncbi:MAG: hypothetical protein GF344_11945 [Chitinivibrionales bacterium]|nr:hypothetical protein [Chitinivibrionales bacterium]